MTVDQVRKRYQTDKLRDYFTEPEVMASERLEDVRRELRILQGGYRT